MAATEVAVRAAVVKEVAGMAGVAVVVTVEAAMEVAATEVAVRAAVVKELDGPRPPSPEDHRLA